MRMLLGYIGTILAMASAQPAAAQFMVTADDLRGPCRLEAPKRGEAPLPRSCAKAIAAAQGKREKAVHYYVWAYSLSDVGNTLAALPYLDKAIALAPDFATAWHERGYVHNDLGMFDLALNDANKAIALVADQPLFYRERAHANHWLARFSDELADRNAAIALGLREPGDIAAQAETFMWLGRYEDAKAALESLRSRDLTTYGRGLLDETNRRMAYQPSGNEAKQCSLQSLTDQDSAEALIDACTWAFDHEKIPGLRADYLTVRGSARIIAKNERRAGLPDFAMAVAIEPDNPDRHFNHGSMLLSIEHSWAARNAFDRGLALPNKNKTSRAMGLGGRAQANYNLGDMKAAKADALAAQRIEPQPPAMLVLARLALDAGDKETARKYLLAAWKLGVQGEDMREMMREAGIDDPDAAAGH